MLDVPTAGEYYFFNESVNSLKEKKLAELHKTSIGFVFQQYHLIDELTVYENLETPLLYQKIKTDERKGRIAEIMDRFNIVAKKDLFPNQLSGGQQQLVAIARAIISHPKLILADEPTGNLHSDQGKEVMELLKKLNDEGKTIVQVTHSKENASYGNRIIRLKDGWIEN
jgi:ABC-type lipoprotein export system ATPase subunit